MTVTMNQSGLQALLHSHSGPVMQHISRLADRVRDRAKTKVSGNLAQSINSFPLRDARGPYYSVRSTLPYALAVEEGTQPHIIRARNKPSLHFFWDNIGGVETFVPAAGGFRTHRDRFGRLWIGRGYVQHPGTQPKNYLSDALSEVIRG